MVDRPRHPNKDIERLLRLAEDQAWRVTRRKGYFLLYCPCELLHKKSIHLTPSDPNYLTNQYHWLRRQECWKEPKP